MVQSTPASPSVGAATTRLHPIAACGCTAVREVQEAVGLLAACPHPLHPRHRGGWTHLRLHPPWYQLLLLLDANMNDHSCRVIAIETNVKNL